MMEWQEGEPLERGTGMGRKTWWSETYRRHICGGQEAGHAIEVDLSPLAVAIPLQDRKVDPRLVSSFCDNRYQTAGLSCLKLQHR